MQISTREGRRIVKRRRMHEELVDYLTKDIREGVYSVGEFIPSERELIEQYGVSRLTVREALAQLERVGLINVRSGMRARVSQPTSEGLLELLTTAAEVYMSVPEGLATFQEVRSLIETGIVRMAADRASDSDIARLEALLEKNRSDVGNVEAFASSDVEFHLGIAKVVNNSILNGFYLAVDRWLHEIRLITLAAPDQMETAYAAHDEIFRAIRGKDSDAAARNMLAHLQQVNSIYTEIR